MAVTPLVLHLLEDQVFKPRRGQALEIVSLGYPDILCSPEQFAHILGPEVASRLRPRPDSDSIARWHGRQGMPIVEAAQLFAELGHRLSVIDITRARGDEILLDLNHPAPADMLARYDLVLDTGTLEHCFNIGQALMNVAGMVRAGGFILQATPLNMFNHGFYNACPTLFHDFYGSNGFEMLWLHAVFPHAEGVAAVDLPAHGRFQLPPEMRDGVMIGLARRPAVQPLHFPIQTKYRNNPELKA